jgi:hypothetical protein
MLGDFPIPTTTLQSVPEEDETAEEGKGECVEGDDDGEDEIDDSDLPLAVESANWYEVIDGPHELPLPPPIEPLATNRNAANAVDCLMTKVSYVYIS